MLSSGNTSNLKSKLAAIEEDIENFQFEEALSKLDTLHESNLNSSTELLKLFYSLLNDFKPELQVRGEKAFDSPIKYIYNLKTIIFTLFEKLSKNTKEEVLSVFRDSVIYYFTKYQYANCEKDKIAYHKAYHRLLGITYKLADLISLKNFSALKVEFESPFFDKSKVPTDLLEEIRILNPNENVPVTHYDPVLFLKIHQMLNEHLAILKNTPRDIFVQNNTDRLLTEVSFALATITSIIGLPSSIYALLNTYNGTFAYFTLATDTISGVLWAINLVSKNMAMRISNKYSADFSELKLLFDKFVVELEKYEDLLSSAQLYHPSHEFSFAKELSDEIANVKFRITNVFTFLEKQDKLIVIATDQLLKELKSIITMHDALPKVCQRYLLFSKYPIEKSGEYNLSKLFQM